MVSRLSWQTHSPDALADVVDAYTLEPIGEGEAYVTCAGCRRAYLLSTIVGVSGPNRNRCPGCRSASMLPGIRAFAGNLALEPDPSIVSGSMASLQAAVRRASGLGTVVRVPLGTYRGTLILEGAVTIAAIAPDGVNLVGEGSPAVLVRRPASTFPYVAVLRAVPPCLYGITFSVDGPVPQRGRALTRAVIAVEAGALAIQSCTIDASGVDGIAVVGASSRATITQTTVLRAAGYGINVDQRASVTIDDVEVTDAQVAGLRVVAGSIAANRLAVRGGPVAGIVLSAGATGTLSASEVTGIGRVNIAIVGSGTAPDVVGCTVRDGAGTGILVSENATPTIDRCTVSGQLGTGIEVCTDAYPIVRDCTVRDGRARGIWTRSGGRGEIERCSVTGHVSSADIEVTAATRIILAEVPGGTAPVVATRTSGAIGARPARPFRPRVTAPPTEGVRGSTFTDSATSATPGVLPRVVASARVLAS